jgi:quercetin 2,3-dioxygenase
MNVRKATERGYADCGWLKTYHTFSFADYYDPAQMGYRALRVINEDTIAPGAGFPTHRHRDMEIISYVLSGALEHNDSLGNGRIIRPGEFQYMAAGTGVAHSEFNPSASEPGHFLQIWIEPETKGIEPRYAEKSAMDLPAGRLHLVASRSGRDNSIRINQDVDLYLARLNPGKGLNFHLAPSRHAWLQVAEGEICLRDTILSKGDGAGFEGETWIDFTSEDKSQVLLFDLS